MTEIFSLAALWLALALIATLLAIWLRIATAMSEIAVGTVAQLVIGALLGAAALGTDQSWMISILCVSTLASQWFVTRQIGSALGIVYIKMPTFPPQTR